MAKKRQAAEVTIDINANVASLEKNMKKAVGQIDTLQRRVQSMDRVLKAAFAFEIGKTIAPQLAQLGNLMTTLADKGDKASAIADSFKALGGSAGEIDKASKAILGAVDSFDLMRLANEGLLKQIPGFAENFSLIADYGNRIADALGGDTASAISQVTDALATGKDKQLAAIGVTIDADKAYRDYAASIKVAAKDLTDAEKLYVRQAASLEAVKQKLESLPKPALSYTDGINQINVALQEGSKLAGIAINDNEELAKAFEALAQVIKSVDWTELGRQGAEFFATLLRAGGAVLPTLIQWTNDFATAWEYLFGESLQADKLRIADEITRLKNELDIGITQMQGRANRSGPFEKWLFGLNPEDIQAETERLKREIRDAEAAFVEIGKEIDDQKGKSDTAKEAHQQLADALSNLGKANITAAGDNERNNRKLEEQEAQAKKTKAEVKKLKEEWANFLGRSNEDSIKQQIEDAISVGDSQAFDILKEKLRASVEEGFIKEWQDAIDKGAVGLGEVAEVAKGKGQKAVDEITGRFKDQMDANSDKIADTYKAAFDRVFSNLGASTSKVGDQLGVDLGGIFDAVSENFGDDMQGIFDDIASSLGMEGNAKMSAGGKLGSYANVGMEVLGNALSAQSIDKANKTNKGTGGAVGSGIGAIGGAIFGGPFGAAVGAQIGKVVGEIIGDQIPWGPQNKETKARHVFANWLEDQLAGLDAVSFMQKNGQFATLKGSMLNFVEGDTGRFNTPGWADQMDTWGGKARTMFDGLGSALKEMLGITEDVAGQLGFLLGENLAGNIDNARLLVYQLGISFEDLQSALLNAAKKGTISWREFTIQVAGLNEAFKEGREGIADIKGAWDQFLGSGGRGMAALKGIKDIAIEAGEAGAKTLEQLREAMLAKGVSAEDADAFIRALNEQGVKSVEEIKNLSEAQMGAVVSSVEAASQTIADKWKEIGTNLEKLKLDMDSLPTEKDIKINFKANFDENMQAAKEAGLLTLSGNSSFGQVDTRALNTKSSRISAATANNSSKTVKMETSPLKSNNYSVTIDARGADAGVEQRLEKMFVSYEDRIVSKTARVVMDNVQRGG